MRFTFKNAEYSISFSRSSRDVTRFDGTVVPSKFPYTTVKIEKYLGKDEKGAPIREKVREATVGMFYKERDFTYEGGRLAALRNVSLTLDKDFKTAMWQAYTKRRVKANV